MPFGLHEANALWSGDHVVTLFIRQNIKEEVLIYFGAQRQSVALVGGLLGQGRRGDGGKERVRKSFLKIAL